MARPSKYTKELKDQIAGYITDGLTIRDACFGAGISEDTFWRWNREKLEFAEAIKQATANQKWSSEALARTSGYRRYARKAQICSRKPLNRSSLTHTRPDGQKPQNQVLTALSSISVTTTSRQSINNEQSTLSTRTEPLINPFGELMPTKPYYNPATHKVEWVEKELYGRCVLHRCDLDLWKTKVVENSSP